MTRDNIKPLQLLDIETVCATKPDSVVAAGRSLIPWHAIATLYRLLLKIVTMPFRAPLFYIELSGDERHSGEKLTVIYIGDKSSYEYLLSNLFSAEPELRVQRRIRWWMINRQLKAAQQKADLLVGDIDFPLDALIKKQGTLVSPRWLKQKVAIADKWQDVLANLRRKTRREALRSIRKHNLKARVVRDADSDRYFYHQLYKPYIHKRYGTQAALVDERRFLNECSNGQLIQITQNGNILGVVLVHISGKQLTIAWTGIEKNVDDNQCNGVADALDLYSLMFAYSQGCDVMDMGGSRPMVNDGVLRYKKKWGAAVSLGLIPKGCIFYLPCKMTTAVESFLEKNPMIIVEDKKLSCISWHFENAVLTEGTDGDPDYLEQITNQLNKLVQPGIEQLQCYQIVDEATQQEITATVAGLPCRISCISHNRALGVLTGAAS